MLTCLRGRRLKKLLGKPSWLRAAHCRTTTVRTPLLAHHHVIVPEARLYPHRRHTCAYQASASIGVPRLKPRCLRSAFVCSRCGPRCRWSSERHSHTNPAPSRGDLRRLSSAQSTRPMSWDARTYCHRIARDAAPYLLHHGYMMSSDHCPGTAIERCAFLASTRLVQPHTQLRTPRADAPRSSHAGAVGS